MDGKPLNFGNRQRYLLLNKPVGYLTALSDRQGRRLVTDLLTRNGSSRWDGWITTPRGSCS